MCVTMRRRSFREPSCSSARWMASSDSSEFMPQSSRSASAPSVTTKANIQFDLSGDGGGKWWVRIHDGKAESGKGDPGEPANLTLLADAHDWVKIMTGQMDATAAFMQGKLKIKGDMGLAIKMQSMFRRPS